MNQAAPVENDPRVEELQKALKDTCDIAQAFLQYFNPAVDLASAKENQWWAVYDQIGRARHILAKTDSVDKPLYYVEGRKVFKRPVAAGPNETMGFFVCEINAEIVGGAEHVAKALNDLGE